MRTIKSEELQKVVDNLNPIINKIQRDIRKIKRHLNLTATAGKCICIHSMLPSPDCPIHGWAAIYKKQKATYDRLNKAPDPLHVRVAKALGHDCWTDPNGKWRSHMGRFIPNGVEYPFIPDYPNDRDAAMGVLREYCKKKKYERFGRLVYRPDSEDYAAEILDNSDSDAGWGKVWVTADTLPQVICEAIVAHAEGK